MSFWRRPQTVLARRILFQIHVWTGIVSGVYAVFIGVTGSLLVFRPELQVRMYPEFFTSAPAGATLAAPETVFANLRRAFPGYRFSGVDFPNARRGTFLAYLARGGELKTVFADPISGRVIGELPRDGWIQQLQDLHFNFRSGQTGYLVNGIGAGALLVMCLTGVVVWWPGVARVRQAFLVHRRRGWKRLVWELHGAAGIWTVLLLVIWSLSGVYFSVPLPFRSIVAAVAPLTSSAPPSSRVARPGAAPVVPSALVAQAHARVPGAQLARVMLPYGENGSYSVVLARERHGDWDSSDEVTLYFDQHSGEWLGSSDHDHRTPGDRLLTWLGLLHVGSFGGRAIKVIWLLGGLALPLLWLTGLAMWWNRFVVVRFRAIEQAAPAEPRTL